MAKLANVLIVDDNPRCLEFMTLAFEAQGGVTVASELRPVNAVERIRVEKPDLVVLDVKMPDVDGFTVLSLLRREGNAVPIVMCSGSGFAEGRRPRLRQRMQWLSRKADDARRLPCDGRRGD